MVEVHRRCAECGEPIPPARVKALGTVRLCVECAEDAERERARYAPRRSPVMLGQEWLEEVAEDLEEVVEG